MNNEEKQMIIHGLGGIIGGLDRFEISSATANKIMDSFRNYMQTINTATVSKEDWSQQDHTLLTSDNSMPAMMSKEPSSGNKTKL